MLTIDRKPLTTERKPLHVQFRELRERKRMTLEQAAYRARMTVEQAERCEAGLCLFSAAMAYACGLGKHVVTRGFFPSRLRTVAGMSEVLGMSRNTVAKAVRIANSPRNVERDDDCEISSIESILFAWSPTATLALSD